MSDEQVINGIKGVLAVAASNFPSSTNITISTNGKNSASVQLPYYTLDRIMRLAEQARTGAADT